MRLSVLLLATALTPQAEAMGSMPDRCLSGDVTITRDTSLEPGCEHKATLWLAASGITLDCRGSRVDASGRPYGIVVGGRNTVSGVTVRNCHVHDAQNGIYVGLLGPDAAKAKRSSRDALYARTPHQVRITGCSVRDSASVGIYIDDYVSEVAVENTTVLDSGSAGIYLEHSSRQNRILRCTLTGNGYGKFPWLRLGIARREAIAVDSSAHNLIAGNHIQGNAAGGIFLYKNCHERARTDPASTPRWQPAEHNRIAGNTIEDERVGVWLASRQSRDLSDWDCGDPPYAEGRYFLDHARHNTVEANTFRRVGVGVRVEDDDNAVVGNSFTRVGQAFEIGGRIREQTLGRPVTGTRIEANQVQEAP